MTDTVEAKDLEAKDLESRDMEAKASNMETQSALPPEETERLSSDIDRKSTRLNSSHRSLPRMPSSA